MMALREHSSPLAGCAQGPGGSVALTAGMIEPPKPPSTVPARVALLHYPIG
jgi:hypothetical protein